MKDHEQPVFAALADPMRRELLVNLAESSPKTATQLAKEYPITRQGILKHLNILEVAGIAVVVQKGREKRYILKTERLKELVRWIERITKKLDKRLRQLKAVVEKGGL